MFSLGPYQLPNRWILAPMAGVSEMPFRVIAFAMGAGLCPTELVSAKGLIYGNERTKKYLRFDPKVETPFSVQLFGGEAELMAQAAEMATEAGAQIIDINMGCPVKKVTRTGAGSALLCDTARAQALVKAIKARVSAPVTCKIRSGWDANTINCHEVARALQDAGASAIALHPRTRAQGYAGKADWSHIARLREVLSSAALIGNGDVTSKADAERMLKETGCDFVMVGRAALGNPWIFRELNAPLAQYLPPTGAERAALILHHLAAHIVFHDNEIRALRSFRQHLIWYSRGLQGGKFFRERIVQLNERPAVEALVQEFFAASSVDEAQLLDAGDVDYQTAFG